MPRVVAVVSAILLTLVACWRPTPPPVRTGPPITTAPLIPITLPPTTTTLPSIEVTLDGATPELTEAVASLYGYAAGLPVLPPAPEPLIESLRNAGVSNRYLRGSATVNEVAGVRIAVVEIGTDVIGAAESEKGWMIVAARLDSLLIDPYWGRKHWQLLVVGSDARPGQKVLKSRADSLHIVALDGTGKGAVVGIPRDSWVSIPGHGKGKINSSLALGGPELMMDTFENVTEINLDGYLVTGFAGFIDLITVLGGLDIDVPIRVRDSAAHANISKGRQTLNGKEALAFSRARKTLARGDLTRQEHGGLVLLAAIAMVRTSGPSALPDLLARAKPFIETDLPPGDLLAFSLAAVDAQHKRIKNIVVSARIGQVGAASVVFLNAAAFDTFEDLKDGDLD